MNGPWDGGWLGFGMMLGIVVFLALIVLGVVFVARSTSDGGRTGTRSEGKRALDIFDERLARGEVDQEEYQELRRILTGGK